MSNFVDSIIYTLSLCKTTNFHNPQAEKLCLCPNKSVPSYLASQNRFGKSKISLRFNRRDKGNLPDRRNSARFQQISCGRGFGQPLIDYEGRNVSKFPLVAVIAITLIKENQIILHAGKFLTCQQFNDIANFTLRHLSNFTFLLFFTSYIISVQE